MKPRAWVVHTSYPWITDTPQPEGGHARTPLYAADELMFTLHAVAEGRLHLNDLEAAIARDVTAAGNGPDQRWAGATPLKPRTRCA